MAKKTSTKKTKKTQKANLVVPVQDVEVTKAVLEPVTPPKTSKSVLSPRLLSTSLVIVGIALLTYKLGPYFVPALVGTTPVTRFEIWNRLESAYGTQTLDDLVNEKLLDQAIAKSGVKVDESKVDAQIKDLEKQYESLGGLEAALSQRGMKTEDLKKQVRTQLSVEEILKDKTNVSDEDLKKAFDEGAKTTYKDKKFEDVKEAIKSDLTQAKLVEAFREWFEGVKTQSKVKNFGL